MSWAALAARARGLSTRLYDEDAVVAAERAHDRGALTAALAHLGLVVADAAPATIEAALRARDRDERVILARWSEDGRALRWLSDAEDRRSLRTVIRGVAASAPSSARLAGLTPTATLPPPALEGLAQATSAAELASLLIRNGHEAAPALAELLATTPLDLLAIEVALTRWYAARVDRDRTDHALDVHVSQELDVANAIAALLLAARGRELDRDAHFVPGGARLAHDRYLTAAAATATAAAAALAPAFAGTPVAAALADGAAPYALERAALDWQLATAAALRRTEPLGLGPLLYLVLRRRAETRRLRRSAWRVAMAGPEGGAR